MRYALLINNNEATEPQPGSQVANDRMAVYAAFTQDLVASGRFVAGERLRPTATATTVRTRDGKDLITDGPFAETHEQLAGFYLVECKDLDEAIDCAKRIPAAATGSIEVRPIWEMGD